ncbi:exportin-6 [Phlebotomus argentipes]|uniref:exportin-6 n=1 Tax=Phlebotomus argentipes TaxID=94469 RepID=UPI002893036C|nr:exportin-6 [Phlebotomus argentipes]
MVSIESGNQKLSYCEIESLWHLFNAPTTNNEKKHEIEARLRCWQLQEGAWQLCLPQLSDFGATIWFFNASTVEVTISRGWGNLPVSSRTMIRSALWGTYMKTVADMRFQRNKLAQLIALVGKREFPQDHSGYMNDVGNLLKVNFSMGILLLRCTSEEVTSTKEDVTSERKRHFQSCVAACVPDIFRLLNKFLSVTLFRVSRAGQVFANGDVKLEEFEGNLERSSLELLTCVQHMFSWVPLEHVLDDFLLGALFELAKWNDAHSDVATSTLTTICELFYRQSAIPHVAIATGIMALLQANLSDASEMYQDKLTELLRLFTTQQTSRWISDETFLNLLCALYKFTFAGYGALAFTERLTIWTPIVKVLLPKGFGVYNDLLMSLAAGTINKMQFQNDQNEGFLELLDNSTLDDDLETEWQHFLTQCIESVALIAEGSPEPVLEIVLNAWKASFEVFLVIEKAIINESSLWTSTSKCHYIHCVLRDLSSLCQTLSRLVPIIEACSERVSEFVLTVAIGLVLTVKFLATKKPYKMSTFTEEIQVDFAETLAQMLAALRGLLPWSTVLKFDASVNSLIDVVVHILLPTETLEPKIVTLAAAQLLIGITSIMRPSTLQEQSGMVQLIQAGRNLSHLDRQTSQLVYQSICNCLILPQFQGAGSHDHQMVLNQRTTRLSEYINTLAKELLQLGTVNVSTANRVTEVVTSVLPILRDILDYYESAASVTKQILLSAFRGILEKSLQIYNDFYTSCPGITDTVLSFGFSVIRTLQIQLGTEYVRHILGNFLNACTKNSFTESQMKSTETLLQILCLIVKTSGASVLLPAILELTLDHLVPFLVQERNWTTKSDIVATLYELFDAILINHWQYFYKTSVLRRLKTDEHVLTEGEKVQHVERFLAILTMYGDALVQNDPHICQIVLKSLQAVNEHWKLYQKETFQTHLLSSFQYTLINCLLMPEGALFYDQLMQTLFTMGQVNTQTLYRSFLSAGFTPESEMVREICATSDLPTFSFRMGHLIQDTRCGQSSKSQVKGTP